MESEEDELVVHREIHRALSTQQDDNSESRLLISLAFLLNVILCHNVIRMDGRQYLRGCLVEIHQSCLLSV